CYTIDYQGVRLISLDSNRMHAEQAIWLEKVLADNPNPWTIVTFHHPLFSTAKGRDNKTWRETIQPILDRHRVDLVLQGHDHTYGRSNLVVGANHRTPAGTVYVVSVSGPKMYNLEPQDWMARAAEDTQLYQIIRVEGNVLRYEARTAIGTTYDSFRLTKRRGKPNRLDNLIPATPENRRVPPPSGRGTSAEWFFGLAALGSLVLVRRSVS
ncbi:MAG: metallophosphoesterase, partial [Nitrospirae bacterium]|nr:metallophosphoesterase [Fimbriimonadaceae bacterium]